ncbi:MAG: 2-octaprenyl-3-methyl-6-methoxy,4-benzoquinol hydroxylase / 2-octaprenyl-6-methoxyphenol [Gammaproteobacteria bacterium]|jgi:2-octaprenyl-6-methoxyphenol hydroxylase|nr:2-octaprenyl-3-methyl-6-methoxy,4-benzoquinol hydroxylase / 2-octaprenyl-6-methoxyphenol [Gammaproteobacteria bacterium]
MDTQFNFDIVIIGGGLVGTTLALALEPLNLNIAIVEAQAEQHFQESSLDARSLALAYGSAKILQGIDLWQFLEAQTTAIKHIHISDKGHFGFTRLDSEQAKVEALGYVIEVSALSTVLYERLKQSKIQRFFPANLISLDQSDPNQVKLELQSENGPITLANKLVLGADGANSAVRRLLDIDSKEHDYEQVAIVSNIALKRSHENKAYERFTEEGPLALLPLSDQRMAVVWTVGATKQEQILNQSDQEFLMNLQAAFGYRLGKFLKVGKRQVYPLKQLKVDSHYKGRVALIGNSAHSLHPVGGQGFNLSMRDIAALASLIAEHHYQEKALDESVFEKYRDLRKLDQSTMLHLTDSLVKIFSNHNVLYSLPRNIALQKLERCPPVKNEINKLMMGVHGRLNRLSRGLKLEQNSSLL